MEKLNEGGEGSGRYPKGSGGFSKNAGLEYRKTIASHIRALRRSYGSNYQGRFSGAHASTANWIRKQYKDAKTELPRGLKKYFKRKYEIIQNEGGAGSGRYPKGSGDDQSNDQKKTKSWQELQNELDKIQRYTELWFQKRKEFSDAYHKAHGGKSEMEIKNMNNIKEGGPGSGRYPKGQYKGQGGSNMQDLDKRIMRAYLPAKKARVFIKNKYGKTVKVGAPKFSTPRKTGRFRIGAFYAGGRKYGESISETCSKGAGAEIKKIAAATGSYPLAVWKAQQMYGKKKVSKALSKSKKESIGDIRTVVGQLIQMYEGGPGSGRYPAGSGDRKMDANMIRYARQSGGRRTKIAGRSKRLSKDYQKQWMKFQVDMQRGPRQPGS